MTTSLRTPAGTKWDFSQHAFKQFHPFCEPGLVSICFLSCGRPMLAKESLSLTLQATIEYDKEIEWLFLEQSDDQRERHLNVCLYDELLRHEERSVLILPNRNYGINNGWNQLISLSRGEFFMLHENDWLNVRPDVNFLQVAIDILKSDSHIGMVQLRDPYDPNENWGLHKADYSPWTCDTKKLRKAGVCLEGRKLASGHEFVVSDLAHGYNHNPIIIRKSLWQQVAPLAEPPFGTDPRHGETHMEHRVHNTSCLTAHINLGVYRHIGGCLRAHYEKML